MFCKIYLTCFSFVNKIYMIFTSLVGSVNLLEIGIYRIHWKSYIWTKHVNNTEILKKFTVFLFVNFMLIAGTNNAITSRTRSLITTKKWLGPGSSWEAGVNSGFSAGCPVPCNISFPLYLSSQIVWGVRFYGIMSSSVGVKLIIKGTV